jgi:type IV pilus assembly protein PilM
MLYYIEVTMFDFLKKVIPALNVNLTPEKTALGIDIGSSAIKIVQLKKEKGRVILETYGEIALGPYNGLQIGQATNLSNERTAEALNDLLKESKATTNQCGIAIPFSASLMSVLEFPKVSEDDLKQMIPLEARKYIPVPISEVNLDWWVVPKITENYDPNKGEEETSKAPVTEKIEVLIAAIHKDVLAKYNQIVTISALKTTFFEIEFFSSLRSVLRRDLGVTMVVDVGASGTKVLIVERGILRTSHIINRGSQDITLAIARSLAIPIKQAEELKRKGGEGADAAAIKEIISLTTSYILSEVSRIIINFERKYNNPVSKVVFTGGGSLLNDFLKEAKNVLAIDVEMASPFSNVEYPAFLDQILKSAGPEFAVAIGLALRKLEESD